MMFSFTVCGMHPLKPNYSNLKCSTNYLKYSGLNKHVLQKPNLTRHQCEDCNKSFKNKLMKDFHKRIHLCQLSTKNFGVNGSFGNSLKDQSKVRKTNQLQKYWKSGEQIFDELFNSF